MPRPNARRRHRGLLWFAILASTATVLGLVGKNLLAQHMRQEMLPELAQRFGRDVLVGDIQFGFGSATLSDISVRGSADPLNAPLAQVKSVTVEVDMRSLLHGEVVVNHIAVAGVEAQIIRNREGQDNVSDLLRVLSGGGASSASHTGSSRLSLSRASLSATDISLRAHDERTGAWTQLRSAKVLIDSERNVELMGVELSGQAPVRGQDATVKLSSAQLRVNRSGHIQVSADALQLASTDPRLQETLAQSSAVEIYAERVRGQKGEWVLNVMGELANESAEASESFLLSGTRGSTGGIELRVRAENLQLARLAPLLRRYPELSAEEGRVSGEWTLNATREELALRGEMSVDSVALSHSRLAHEPVVILPTTIRGHASFDLKGGEFRVDSDIESGSVPYHFSADLLLPGYGRVDHPEAKLRANLSMPEVLCQDMLESIPYGLAPELDGFELEGQVHGDLKLAIDWADFDLSELDSSIDMSRCQVIAAPQHMSAARLKGSFEHKVPVPEGWRTFTVGPENPDFVPLKKVSNTLKRSFLTTEDSAFFRHQGFITQEFQGALIKNLKRGRFAYGASSISMQVVKNVLLSREKTIARKLQELFLTWHLENSLSKDRILEIYVNAIEFGPGLYGIKPAARQYFSKHPRSLNSKESAFMSSLLPAPTRRYRQYCRGRVGRTTSAKIERILGHMHKRKRLDEEEYALALETPLAFRGRRSAFCKRSNNENKKGKKS